MRGFVVSELKHHSKIPLSTSAPEPKPGPGQVLVDVYSAGLNFFDTLQTQGKYQSKPPLPFVLGTEFAGRISKDSPIVKGCPYKPGDRVFGAAQGTYADKVAANVEQILPLPDNMTYDQGAGLFITWPTSYEALVGRAELKPGEWVLVTAAAGGVGIAAVQLAKVLGAKVIAAAGSDSKIDIAKHYGGADFGVNYSKPGWQKEVLKLTGGKGADVIYDPVGLINDSLKCIAWKGRVLVIGFASGTIEQVPMNLVLLKNISLVGLHWGPYAKFEQDRVPVIWKALLDLFASGKTVPVIYKHIYTLEKLSEALAAIERRETWGKAIVRIRDEPNAKL
ncbi:Quinone oxidoreductase-like protein 2 [Termitomyces sp. T112]|nr:Quinone oxidoreductase-like protein 2 [Termitomyces sp. T112]KNZ77745.1 Quinone oxidoreductase-like protein 2 [Termitomyces sp. J132]